MCFSTIDIAWKIRVDMVEVVRDNILAYETIPSDSV